MKLQLEDPAPCPDMWLIDADSTSEDRATSKPPAAKKKQGIKELYLAVMQY